MESKKETKREKIEAYPVTDGGMRNFPIQDALEYDEDTFLEGKTLDNIRLLLYRLIYEGHPLFSRFMQGADFEGNMYFSLCGFGCNKGIKENIEKFISDKLLQEKKQGTEQFDLVYDGGSLVLSFPPKENFPIL